MHAVNHKHWRIVLICAFLFGSACGHHPPTEQEAVNAAADLYRRSTMNVARINNKLESGTLHTAEVHGDSATAHMTVNIKEDDGTFGASCQNFMGCFRHIKRDCTIQLAWQGGWVAAGQSLTCL